MALRYAGSVEWAGLKVDTMADAIPAGRMKWGG
jgi:hypothetical protein